MLRPLEPLSRTTTASPLTHTLLILLESLLNDMMMRCSYLAKVKINMCDLMP